MQSALILMTILGCDDSATQCHYVETVDQRWETIEACDAGSEDRLKNYAKLKYPVVVAVCQTPKDNGMAEAASENSVADAAADKAGGTAHQVAKAAGAGEIIPPADIPPANSADPNSVGVAKTLHKPGILQKILPDADFASRVIDRFKKNLPELRDLSEVVEKPVHVVNDGYSWVAKRFKK